MKKTFKLTLFANLLAIAIILTLIEAQISIIPVPNAKLGLANIMTILVMVSFGWKETVLFTLLRVFLAYMLSGRLGPTFAMSMGGAVLSAIIMLLLYKIDFFGLVGISVIGSLSHAIGQAIVGIFVIGSKALLAYLPIMFFLSIPSGFLVGLLADKFISKSTWFKKKET